MNALGPGEAFVIMTLLVCGTVLIYAWMNKWRHDR